MTFEERLAAQLYLERRAHAETRRKADGVVSLLRM